MSIARDWKELCLVWTLITEILVRGNFYFMYTENRFIETLNLACIAGLKDSNFANFSFIKLVFFLNCVIIVHHIKA